MDMRPYETESPSGNSNDDIIPSSTGSSIPVVQAIAY